ncbi:hypothetical protein IIC68_02190, partial [archaeon]|nr:hypothetical protein [archaeon]
MKKKIPRRLQRFERKNMTEKEVKDKSTSIALKEVDSFREKHERYPAPAELDQISENVFTQLKKEMNKKKEEKIPKGTNKKIIKRFNGESSTIYHVFFFALYMGCNPIHLVGCDCTSGRLFDEENITYHTLVRGWSYIK